MRYYLLAIFSVASLILSLIPAFATEVNFTKIQGYKSPDGLQEMIGDARINIYDYDYAELGSIVIVNGTVKSAGSKFVENPTHKVYVRDSKVVDDVFQGGLKEFNLHRSVNSIRIEAQDFGGQIKLAIGTIVVSIISLFLPPK